MVRNRRLLCGTAAMGDIFSFGGGFPLMLSHLIMHAYPWATFSSVLARMLAMTAGLFADRCGPHSMAAVMCSIDQSGLQSTGQPAEA